MRALEVLVWLVFGAIVGTLGDNPLGWTLFGVVVLWATIGSLPVWARHPRFVGFCRGVATCLFLVTAGVTLGLLSLGGPR